MNFYIMSVTEILSKFDTVIYITINYCYFFIKSRIEVIISPCAVYITYGLKQFCDQIRFINIKIIVSAKTISDRFSFILRANYDNMPVILSGFISDIVIAIVPEIILHIRDITYNKNK